MILLFCALPPSPKAMPHQAPTFPRAGFPLGPPLSPSPGSSSLLYNPIQDFSFTPSLPFTASSRHCHAGLLSTIAACLVLTGGTLSWQVHSLVLVVILCGSEQSNHLISVCTPAILSELLILLTVSGSGPRGLQTFTSFPHNPLPLEQFTSSEPCGSSFQISNLASLSFPTPSVSFAEERDPLLSVLWEK